MWYVIANEDYTQCIDFKVNGNFVLPDNSLYSFKIRNTAGEVIYSKDNLTIGTSPVANDINTHEVLPVDCAMINIPAEFNTKEEGTQYESRILEVTFYVDGKPCVSKYNYRVIDYAFFEATPKDVREYYGLNEGELPDDAIDLINSYMLAWSTNGDKFIECLRAGGLASIRANRLITLYAAKDVYTSIRLRVNQEENDGSSKFIRYLNKIDWDKFLINLNSEITELELNLSGTEEFTRTEYSPFFLGAVTDAITGSTE